ncbi:TPA: hypothetical protein ACT9LS_002524 [Legionella pneumophila]
MTDLAKRAENQMTCSIANNENESGFKRQLIHDNALANNSYTDESFDLDREKKSSKEAMTELNASNGLQSMLTAQMLSIHKMQQKSMCYAQNINNQRLEKYYVNSAIKLANCFVQQANLLAKLQGMGGQKIIVERVDVHEGGQAIVGNVQRGGGNKEN